MKWGAIVMPVGGHHTVDEAGIDRKYIAFYINEMG